MTDRWRGIDKDYPVHVYWNLHKQLWSVRQRGRVVAHMSHIHLREVEWRVQPAGQAKVRREKRKNIHAYAKGWAVDHVPHHTHWYQVRYNPYTMDTFMANELPVGYSEYAWFDLAKRADPREVTANRAMCVCMRPKEP